MISAIVLIKNEEKTLRRCLESLRWCDEVVVMDDYSSDTSLSIAKAMGATIVRSRLDDNYAHQRNKGLLEARGEWVLFVDADEIVSPELADEIRQRVQEDHIDAFKVRRLDFIFGCWLKHGETANVWLTRLGKKNCGMWKRAVHETWQIKGKVGVLTSPLFHYPHKDLASFLKKINHYTTINARIFYRNGTSSSWLTILTYPVAKFTKNYIFLRGLLDGMPGLMHALVMSLHSFLTRAKLYLEINKKKY